VRIFFVLLAFALALAARAQSTNVETETRALTLEQSILIALQHNFDIQISRYDPQVARFTLSGSYGTYYDPVFSFSGEHDFDLSPGGVDAQGRPFAGREVDTDQFTTGIKGMLPWGLNYSIGGTASDQSGSSPTTIFGTNVTSITTNSFLIPGTTNLITLLTPKFNAISLRSPFEVTSANAGVLQLRQPLLKNFWIDADRYQIFVNKIAVQQQDVTFRDLVMRRITDVENAYFNLVFADENVRVQQKALELAERLYQENRKRVEVGSLAPLDEKQAESQAASSKADLLAAQSSRATSERVLKALLSDKYTNEWAWILIQPTDKLLAIPQTYNLQESWHKGLTQGGSRVLLQQTRLTYEQDKRALRLARNQLFPQLDAFGSYGYSGSGKEFSDAFEQIRNRDNPFWTAGAQISMPLSLTSERNSFKAAKATKEQQALKIRAAEQSTLILIENDVGTAQSDFERVSATRQATLYAEAALEAEQKKLENGKSTSFEVLQLQKNLTDARSAEIRALADYNVSLAELAFDEGETLNRHRIDLKDVK
jgi:outer membrane protein TolC